MALLRPRSSSLFPSRALARARERSRRDFLAWVAGGTALAAMGCAAEADNAEDLGELEEAWHTCRVTSRDARGPYWEPGSPRRPPSIAASEEPGVRLLVEGYALSPDCRSALPGYALDVWQADAQGNYYDGASTSHRLRGKVVTDAQGIYRFETILPGHYGDAAGIRPAHLHLSFLSPGGGTLLTTQLYFEGDPHLGEADYCTRGRTCDSADPARHLRLRDSFFLGRVGKRARFDAVLPRT
jgi:catechol 1,2-dioxygenase